MIAALNNSKKNQIFHIWLKQFFKRKLWVSILLGLLVSQVWYVIYYIQAREGYYIPTEAFCRILETCSFSFAIYLFLSYQFFLSDVKYCGTKEVVSSVPGGRDKTLLGKFFVLSGINFIHMLCLYIFEILVAVYQNSLLKEYVCVMFLALFLYFFLNNIFGIILGMGFSYIKSQYVSFLCVVLAIYFFVTNFSNEYLKAFQYEKTLSYSLGEMLQIFPRSLFLSISRELYVVGLESINWQKTIFWILLAMIIAIIVIYGKKRLILLAYTMCLLVLDIYMYVQPASYFYASEWMDAACHWMNPINYYLYGNQEGLYWELSERVKESFGVEQYVLDVDCDRVLSVKAEIVPDRKLEEYAFTLAHEYQILKLEDQYGNDLEYERIGDYFIITESFEGSFSIWYEGAADWFPANRSVMALNPYFPWYPQAGIKKVFDMETLAYDSGTLLTTSVFDVTINTPGRVFSNLEEMERGVFYGESNGCLIMKGIGIGVTYVDDNKIVYPQLLYRTEEEVQQEYKELVSLNEVYGNVRLNGDWYVIPIFGNGTYGSEYFVLADCFGGYAETLEYAIKESQ